MDIDPNPDWAGALDRMPRPKYLALVALLADDIRTGRLGPGDRLPPQRRLAEDLGLDLTTVTRAFNEAHRLGLIVAEGRRGSFVRRPAPSDAPAIQLDISMNMPPELPEIAAAIATGYAAVLAAPEALLRLHYQDAAGSAPDRAAAAALLRARIPSLVDENVLIAAGGQNALHAILALAFRHGDSLCVSATTYPGFLALARRLGLRTVPLPMDELGILPAALEAACRQTSIAGLYVVPTNDNPTTATLPADRRRAIAAIAAQHGLAVIEDDAYGQLAQTALAPIAALLPGQTWHIASLSKIIAPALRIAFVVTPGPAQPLAALLHETTGMAAPLNAALVSHWLRQGRYAPLVAAVRAEGRLRQAMARQALPAGQFRADPDGYHLWIPGDGSGKVAAIAQAATAAGLLAVPGAAFSADGKAAGLRISLGGAQSRTALARRLDRLGQLLRNES